MWWVADLGGLGLSGVRELGHPARIMHYGDLGWRVMLLILFDKILVNGFRGLRRLPVSL